MYITWHGLTCVKLAEKTQQRDVTALIDPYAPGKGSLPGVGGADIMLLTAGRQGAKGIVGTPFTIDSAGEYELKGIMIYGIPYPQDGLVLYRFDIDGVHYLHVGAMKTVPPDAMVEELGNVDVLFVPVGGGNVFTPAQAADFVGEVEPKIVIPIAAQLKDIDSTHEPVETFLKAMGQKDAERMEKYKAVKKELPTEGTKVIVLT